MVPFRAHQHLDYPKPKHEHDEGQNRDAEGHHLIDGWSKFILTF
jgi:hypothetical protein